MNKIFSMISMLMDHGIPERVLRIGTIMVYAIVYILISFMILREPMLAGKAVTTAIRIMCLIN